LLCVQDRNARDRAKVASKGIFDVIARPIRASRTGRSDPVPVSALGLRRALRAEPAGICSEPFHVGAEPLSAFPPNVGTLCDAALTESAKALIASANLRRSIAP
jgi:hypothetical protein